MSDLENLSAELEMARTLLVEVLTRACGRKTKKGIYLDGKGVTEYEDAIIHLHETGWLDWDPGNRRFAGWVTAPPSTPTPRRKRRKQ